jgi:ATP-dependent exoDNAse (exonuclease V) beta subunit
MIRASAGSGKTYQLANRFLGLLALGVDPSAIIALTFTRKAAGEFADRILARLAEGASSPEKAEKLAAELMAVLRGDPATGQPALAGPDESFPTLDQARFRELLENLVRSLDRLALGTIDAFFGKIARTSWTELGLGGFVLLDEAEKEAERERIFGNIFSKLRENDPGREEFLQAFKRATFGADENRFVEKLIGFIESTQSTFLKVRDPEAWGNESRLWPMGCPWPDYDSILFKQWAEKLRILTDGRNWGHKTWERSWGNFLEFLDNYEPARPEFKVPLWDRLSPQIDALASGAAEMPYSGKIIRLDGEAATLTADLLGAVLGAEIKAALVKTRGIRDVILRYDHEYDSEVRRRGRLGFDDLTTVLADAGIGFSAAGQNIGYRLDQRFEHWMLDEFQDTDRLQWRVLAGLIDEIAQEELGQRTFFVVGDPKQGIHAWRGGEPRLFDEIAAAWQGRLPEWSMDRSFRSSPAVLDLVNLVCDPDGPGLGAIFDSGPFSPAALARWQFHPHAAARSDRRGESLVLEVTTATSDAGDDDSGAAEATGDEEGGATKANQIPWLAIPAVIERARPLERGLSCAILVQTNANAAALADFLRNERPDWPIEVESETATQNAGPVVAALYDFFRWLETPADRFTWGHVRHCPLHAALAEIFGSEKPEAIWSAARALFQTDGAAGLLDKLFPVLRARNELDASQAARLTLWETEARRFDARGGPLADWVRLLRHWKTREWSGAGAIQIMTIHKAKGLEFDLVVLPDLDGGGFDHQGKLARLQERSPDGNIHLLFDAPPKAVIDADARLKQLRDEWEAEITYERFCTFYVAMTRAARGLVLILPPSLTAKGETAKAKKNHAFWLRAAIEGKAPAVPAIEIPGLDVETLWQHGDADWFAEFPLQPAAPSVPPPVVLSPPSPRLARKTPSSEKASASKGATGAAPDSLGGMAFGTALHEAFEKIAWLDDGAPELSADDPVRKLVEACLAEPAIRGLFTRSGRDIQLLREQPFDTITDGVWTSGVIDRLHLHREHGKAVRADILDFKTDRIEHGEELIERYAGQMRAYRGAVAAASGLAPETIRCLLVSTRLATVVEIPNP